MTKQDQEPPCSASELSSGRLMAMALVPFTPGWALLPPPVGLQGCCCLLSDLNAKPVPEQCCF